MQSFFRDHCVAEWFHFYVKYAEHKQYIKTQLEELKKKLSDGANDGAETSTVHTEQVSDCIELIQQRLRHEIVKIDDFYTMQWDLISMMKGHHDNNIELNEKYKLAKHNQQNSQPWPASLLELVRLLFRLNTYVWQNYVALCRLIQYMDSIAVHDHDRQSALTTINDQEDDDEKRGAIAKQWLSVIESKTNKKAKKMANTPTVLHNKKYYSEEDEVEVDIDRTHQHQQPTSLSRLSKRVTLTPIDTGLSDETSLQKRTSVQSVVHAHAATTTTIAEVRKTSSPASTYTSSKSPHTVVLRYAEVDVDTPSKSYNLSNTTPSKSSVLTVSTLNTGIASHDKGGDKYHHLYHELQHMKMMRQQAQLMQTLSDCVNAFHIENDDPNKLQSLIAHHNAVLTQAIAVNMWPKQEPVQRWFYVHTSNRNTTASTPDSRSAVVPHHMMKSVCGKENGLEIEAAAAALPITPHQYQGSNCNESDTWPDYSETRIPAPATHTADLSLMRVHIQTDAASVSAASRVRPRLNQTRSNSKSRTLNMKTPIPCTPLDKLVEEEEKSIVFVNGSSDSNHSTLPSAAADELPIPSVVRRASCTECLRLSLVMLSYAVCMGFFPFIFKFVMTQQQDNTAIKPWMWSAVVACQWPLYLLLAMLFAIYTRCRQCVRRFTYTASSESEQETLAAAGAETETESHRPCPIHPTIESSASALVRVYRYHLHYCDEDNVSTLNECDWCQCPSSVCDFVCSKHGVQTIVYSAVIDSAAIMLQCIALHKLPLCIYLLLSVVTYALHTLLMFAIFDAHSFCTRFFALIFCCVIQIALCGWYVDDTELEANRSFHAFLYGSLAAIGHHALCALKLYLTASNKYFVQKDLIAGCNAPHLLSMAFCTNLLAFLLTIVWIAILQSEHSHVLSSQFGILLRLLVGGQSGDEQLFSVGLGFCVLLACANVCMFLLKYVTFRKQNQNQLLCLLLNAHFDHDSAHEDADTEGNHMINTAASQPQLKLILTNSLVSQRSSNAMFLPQLSKNANSLTVMTDTGFAHLPQNGNLSMVAMLDAIARTLWLVPCVLFLGEALSLLLLACWAIVIVVVYVACQMLSQSLFSHSTYSWLTFAHNSWHVMYSDIDSMLLSVAFKFYFNFKFYVSTVRTRKMLPLNHVSTVSTRVSTSAAPHVHMQRLRTGTVSNKPPMPIAMDDLYDNSVQVTALKPNPSSNAVGAKQNSLPKVIEEDREQQQQQHYVDVTPPPNAQKASSVKILSAHNQSRSNISRLKVEMSNLSYELSTVESNGVNQVQTQTPHHQQQSSDIIDSYRNVIHTGRENTVTLMPTPVSALSSPSISTPTPNSVGMRTPTPQLAGSSLLPVIKRNRDEAEDKHSPRNSVHL